MSKLTSQSVDTAQREDTQTHKNIECAPNLGPPLLTPSAAYVNVAYTYMYMMNDEEAQECFREP